MNYINTVFLTGSNLTIEKTKDGVNVNGGNEDLSENQSNVAEERNTSTGTPTEAPQANTGFGGTSLWTWGIIYVVVIGGLYFFSIRPQRKREKQAKEMRSALEVGDNIVTTSGLYGKIVDVGGDVFVVEFGTNRGIRIPINKNDIIGKKEPDFTVNN